MLMKKPNSPRSLWPVAIISYFALGITFLVAFIIWASRQHEDLVSQNYYETEIRYQQQIDRLNHSQQFDMLPVVTYDTARRSIIINLPTGAAADAAGRIHLYRPSDARLDCNLPLAINGQGVQELDAKHLAGGLWKVRVQWTVEGREYFCDRSVIVST